MRVLIHSVVVCLLVLCASTTARVAGLSVTGSITDSSGAGLPGVTVELILDAKVVATATTDAHGAFEFRTVTPRRYELRARLNGFKELRTRVIVAGTTSPAPLRLTLVPVSVSQSVDAPAKQRVLAEPPPAAASPVPVTEGVAVGHGSGIGPGFGGGGGGGSYHPGSAQPFNTEAYDRIEDNAFRRAADAPLSTFSIDVDTASYANVRRFLNDGTLPPADAVRVEELINYFHFDYRDSTERAPFGITTEVAECPWNAKHRLALIGLQAKRLPAGKTPPRNLVFLLDVSGSMMPSNKLPLVKTAMKMLAEALTRQDRVAIVVYAGASGLVLPATSGDRVHEIQDAIGSLMPGGSTNGAEGIQLAYRIASENMIKGGINRVILATDGDFNVGVTSQGELLRLIEEKRASGVFLSVLGVGDGNLKDSTMEKLADAGNGNYSYLDSLHEARRVLIAEAGSTLATVAKDVKIQVEFNPAAVGAYRLVGYENRVLKNEDFNNDKKDAGDMGAGHNVTVLYEIVPPGETIDAPTVDPLKYQVPARPGSASTSGELMTVKLRYQDPDGDASRLLTVAVANKATELEHNLGFAAAVAEFGMLLRQSAFKGDATWEEAAELARAHRGPDPDGYRAEFVRLLDLAASLDRQRATSPLTRR
jgi:Ca-activated chloride channel family protein